jgi:hypothetical protein
MRAFLNHQDCLFGFDTSDFILIVPTFTGLIWRTGRMLKIAPKDSSLIYRELVRTEYPLIFSFLWLNTPKIYKQPGVYQRCMWLLEESHILTVTPDSKPQFDWVGCHHGSYHVPFHAASALYQIQIWKWYFPLLSQKQKKLRKLAS